MAIDPKYVWGNAKAVLNARWSLRHVDHVGTRVRLRGRPLVHNKGRMVIGDRVQLISTAATLELVTDEGGLLEIGERSLVNFGTSIAATKLIRIGAHSHIGPHCMLLDNDYHHLEPERRLERPESRPIILEENVWLSARVIVISGVTIGRGSAVGAGSVVTTDVPPRTFVAGVPAKVVKKL